MKIAKRRTPPSIYRTIKALRAISEAAAVLCSSLEGMRRALLQTRRIFRRGLDWK